VPRSFRGEESRGYPEPGAIREYKARSMFEEYKGLAVVFAILGLALAAYFIKSLRAARPPSPPPAQSVYIEVVPQKVEVVPQRAPPAPQNSPPNPP
jgi:hypothetical protein